MFVWKGQAKAAVQKQPAAVGEGGFARVVPDGGGRDRVERVVRAEDDAYTEAGLEKLTRLREALRPKDDGGDAELRCSSRFLRLAGVERHGDKRKVLLEPLGVPLYDRHGMLASARSLSDGEVVARKRRACKNSWGAGGLTLEAVKTAMCDVSLAVLCLHLSGFAHGDLKPDNVVLDCVAAGSKRPQLRALLVDYDSLMPLDRSGHALPDRSTNWMIRTDYFVNSERADFIKRGERLNRERGLPTRAWTPPARTYNAVRDDLFALSKTVGMVADSWLHGKGQSLEVELHVAQTACLQNVLSVVRRKREEAKAAARNNRAQHGDAYFDAARRYAVCEIWKETVTARLQSAGAAAVS